MAPKRGTTKRLGKKHRQASTRPKLGKAPRAGSAKTGAQQVAGAAPKKRKELATKKAAALKKSKTPTRSPEFERRVVVDTERRGASSEKQILRSAQDDSPKRDGRDDNAGAGRSKGRTTAGGAGSAHEERAWREAEKIAVTLTLADEARSRTDAASDVELPLMAICGRPNVGKSTLFNRLTGTRRSIVGDEPGITRDRIYGEVEWSGRVVRIVDTGGVVPDDEALIPAEIFRQARVGLDEADVIVMVVDGRTELASPDMELARLLLRGGKPVFLAVNKIDAPELAAAAENFRRLGFKDVVAISAEHGVGIGDLLDDVWAVLPEEAGNREQGLGIRERRRGGGWSKEDATRAEFVQEEEHVAMEGEEDEELEDMDGGGEALAEAPDAMEKSGGAPTAGSSASLRNDRKKSDNRGNSSDDGGGAEAGPGRRLRSHGEHVSKETKIAIIGRPNVGKSTLLNALTGTDRAIVSPIAGTTRDAVDEVVERDGHDFRFIDTAGIRRKGKTTLLAEKLSVIMSRKHLEAADVALLVIDAAEGVTAADANIGGYAHESGRSVIIIINKWDLMTEAGPDGRRKFDGGAIADQKVYEEQVRDSLKYLDYAPLLFVSAAEEKGIEAVFKKVELVARERRKRVTTGQMNRFLDKVDFQRASVPMSKRVRIYYMTQAAVAPPTFVLFTDRDVKLHFSYERFLGNEIRKAFKFIGSPIWFKVKARQKKASSS